MIIPQNTPAPSPPLRVAIYSHDTMGLGHVRRNLLIANSLHRHLAAEVLLVSGVSESCALHLPPGVDCVTLPSLFKDTTASYVPRRLHVPLRNLRRMRASVIRAAVDVFAPHLFIADNVPRGALGELDPTLRRLRQKTDTRLVLGLRDVLDDAGTIRQEWQKAGNEKVIRDYYDRVWVYGDRQICDPVSEYALGPQVAGKLHVVGYLDQRRRLEDLELLGAVPWHDRAFDSRPMVLCVVGGGQDGDVLSSMFLEATLPPGSLGVLLTGPMMNPQTVRRLQQRAAQRGVFEVIQFLPEADLLVSRAERVICMGGYNTVCSVLSFGKPALVVPRVNPRREQWIRAERMNHLGLVGLLHPARLSAETLSRWLTNPQPERSSPVPGIDMNGLTSITRQVAEMFSLPFSAVTPQTPGTECHYVVS